MYTVYTIIHIPTCSVKLYVYLALLTWDIVESECMYILHNEWQVHWTEL